MTQVTDPDTTALAKLGHVKTRSDEKARARITGPSKYRAGGLVFGNAFIGGTNDAANSASARVTDHPRDERTSAHGDARTIRAVAAGVDSLYASVSERVDAAHLAELIAVRDRAAAVNDDEPWTLPDTDRTFLVQRARHRGYDVRLTAPSLDIWVGTAPDSKRPTLLMELRSLGIHAQGIEAAVGEAHAIAAWFCPSLMSFDVGEGIKVSRIDLYADIQGWAPTLDDVPRWVCRAKYLTRHFDTERDDTTGPTAVYQYGQAFNACTFGRGNLSGRVYDKTLEIRRKGSDWWHAVWQNVDPETPVWRIEVQFRRDALTSFAVDGGRPLSSVRDALEHRQDLWAYALTNWLTLRLPDERDNNRSRWAVDPVWRQVQGITIGSPRGELVRVREQQASHDRLVQGMTGYLTSLVAHRSAESLHQNIKTVDAAMATGTDEDRERAVRMALEGMAPAIRSYCDSRQRRFLGVVESKRRKMRAL